MDVSAGLEAGREILEPLLAPAGFVFAARPVVIGSGGPFAYGVFMRGNRALEFGFRFSLGPVVYRVAESVIDHQEYLRALGCRAQAAYPGFSSDPLDGFRHLRSDLERFGREFLTGTDEEFEQRLSWANEHPKRTGFAAADAGGDA